MIPADEIAKTELSIALLLVPLGEMNRGYVRTFAHGIAKSARSTLRANAVLLLARLAAVGEGNAVAALRVAAGDFDPDVQKNVEIELRKLEHENNREGR